MSISFLLDGILLPTSGLSFMLLGQSYFEGTSVILKTFRDPTGHSWHGDFQNGWDTTVLQNAIDKCNNPNDATNDGTFQSFNISRECR